MLDSALYQRLQVVDVVLRQRLNRGVVKFLPFMRSGWIGEMQSDFQAWMFGKGDVVLRGFAVWQFNDPSGAAEVISQEERLRALRWILHGRSQDVVQPEIQFHGRSDRAKCSLLQDI